MQKINLHTHHSKPDNHIQLLNVFAQDLPLMQPDQFYSTGLHPWHIGKVNLEACIQAVELAAKQKNMLAVGECGLDRAIATDYGVQELYFKKQNEIAEKYAKPLIIHGVRAYSDLMKLKKETKSDFPWILHGFNGNQETTLNLIRHGFYFSIGEALLKNVTKHDIIRTIPSDRLFLETDDQEISILQIYSIASQVLGFEEELLTETIFTNFKTVFGDVRLK
jgi:TatD DNase family protein